MTTPELETLARVTLSEFLLSKLEDIEDLLNEMNEFENVMVDNGDVSSPLYAYLDELLNGFGFVRKPNEQ